MSLTGRLFKQLYATRRGDVLIFNKNSCSGKNGIGISLGTHHQTAELREWSEKEWIGIDRNFISWIPSLAKVAVTQIDTNTKDIIREESVL